MLAKMLVLAMASADSYGDRSAALPIATGTTTLVR
jgi:hypothetical protein